ncbi:MAG: Ig-like domain-containing protein [Gemmatimonadetes bacterium]|nr:Ig-like domain-containing protein [Gemmatimonadota bacterium]MCC7134123.1 Ig-like domain-containing protein [Gemmatimonadales bacterium]
MRHRIILLGLGLAAIGCGGDSVAPPPPNPPPPPPPAAPAAMTIQAGDQQEAVPGYPVAVRPAVRITDAQGNGFPGASVTFAVDTGGGRIEGPAAITDANGVATAGPWTLGPIEGANRLRVTSGTLPPVTLTATGRIPRGTVPTVDRTVTVVLPSGTVAPASLRAVVTHGSVPLDDRLTFTLPFFDEGPQLAVIQNQAGDPLLMGFIDGANRVISARTTAEALLFYDLGAFRIPGPAARPAALAGLRALGSELAPLVTAITQAWASGPTAPILLADAVTTARGQVRQALRAAAPSGPALTTRVSPTGARSGIDVADTLWQHIRVANWYRRRVVAFVDRTGYIPSTGGAPIPSPQAGTATRVGSVNGLQNVAGGFFDIVTGNLAWQPVVPPPIPTPVAPVDARRTDYRVIVVGPGKPSALYGSLTAEQRAAQVDASLETVVLDLVLPLLATTVKGLNAIDSYFGHPQGLAKLENFLDLLPAQVVDKAIDGEVEAAAFETVKLLINHRPTRDALFDLILDAMAKQGINNPGALVQANASLTRVLTVLDIVAGATDGAAVALQIAGSFQVESWDVQVNPSKVKIPEGDVTIGLSDLQLLHVTVLDASSAGSGTPTFEYQWTTTGQFGKLTASGTAPTNQLVTRTDVVTYRPNLSSFGTDRVIVEAFVVGAGPRQSIGADTVTVEVVRGEILLVPRRVSLKDGERHTFTTRVEDARLIGGVLSYRWSTSGKFGGFSSLQNGFETATDQATWVARSSTDGSDQITVEVFSTQNAVRTFLGRATATVKVEKRRSIVFGTATLTSVSFPSGNRTRICAVYYADIPLVQGAKRYVVRGYGFNDPLHYGKQFSFTATVPLPTHVPCSGAGWGINGAVGNVYRHLLTGLSFDAANPANTGQMAARFAGLVIEVEVEY